VFAVMNDKSGMRLINCSAFEAATGVVLVRDEMADGTGGGVFVAVVVNPKKNASFS